MLPLKAGKKSTVEKNLMPDGAVVRVRGTLDETFERSMLVDGLSGTVVFDLDGAERITSTGVREWMTALRTLTSDYYFVNCRPVLVAQFNLVAKFGGTGQLVSFYAPYACSSCGESFDLLIDLREQHAAIASLQSPACNCPKCGSPAELDDVADSYFAFHANKPPLSIPAGHAALLAAAAPKT